MSMTRRILFYARPWRHLLIVGIFALLALTGLSLVTPWLVRDLIAQLETPENLSMNVLWGYAATLAGAYLLRALMRYVQNYYTHIAAWRLVAKMRTMVFDKLQHLSMRYFQDKQTGQLMARMVQDSERLETLVAHATPDLISNGLVLIGVTAILFTINPTLTLYTFIPVPFLFAGGLIFVKKIRPKFGLARAAMGELNATLQDDISGMKEIQAFNQEKRALTDVRKISDHECDMNLAALKLSSIFSPSVEFFTSMGTAIVVVFGGMLVTQNAMATADIVGFIMYLSLFYAPIAGFARVLEDAQNALAGAERVFEVLDAESEVQEKSNAMALEKLSQAAVAFDHVTFSYDPAIPVLEDISFTAKPGEMVAFVGPTGVGKTTIINLFMRFYDPRSGAVTINGHDLRDVTLSSLRENVSIVLQDVFLFNGTIAENIAYASTNATREDIIEAAKIACADEFISVLPQGYDTSVGERGLKLSGGQKQRIAIARAVLRKSPVLILDEATASVDTETESQIQEALGKLAGTRTILVIAHRLSTIERADQILVMQDGRITQRGTHEELLNAEGLYARLRHTNAGVA